MQVTGVQELAWPLEKLGKLPTLLHTIQCNLVLQKKIIWFMKKSYLQSSEH